MRLIDGKLRECRIAAARAAGVVVEQRVANALERLQLKNHGECTAQRLECRADDAIAEYGLLSQEVSLCAQPDSCAAQRHAGRGTCGLIELLKHQAMSLAAHTDPRVGQIQQ